MARIIDKKSIRSKFYIITNGEKTERNYFELIKSKKSVYEVKVLFENADPLGLVNEALKYIKDANRYKEEYLNEIGPICLTDVTSKTYDWPNNWPWENKGGNI